MLQAQSVTR